MDTKSIEPTTRQHLSKVISYHFVYKDLNCAKNNELVRRAENFAQKMRVLGAK